ncbi:caspase family protein [Vibrio aquaticus]|uniref:Caspase family protein n=1 Tax=Vibrio aquaticus TaxID=2496559 RepID=A0A3S0MQ19_9VIBR|nr:caspase family protein [Vibrio aquaticus]RTZ17282.1 caspase family protein [Vibrio aquaticus]
MSAPIVNEHKEDFMRVALLALWILFSQSAWATTYYAVVVGVSEYPNLDETLSLNGPKYDAVRIENMLLQQGVDKKNIRVLADGVEGAPLPTKQNIIDAITEIENQLAKGDFVYLHFSGHGSQQPVQGNEDKSESSDGLDEIFLPRDVQLWSKAKGEVPNSLTDNEVHILTNRLRNKGADVWSIFDSCHSGTMTRSVNGQEFRSRNVNFEQLKAGTPTAGPIPEQHDSIEILKPVALAEGAGSLISFGAAQSNEEAPEMALPNGDRPSPQGLFTYTLTSLISQNPNMSYRQLAQGILSAYNGLPWYRTTPLFEGESLDKPIFHRDGDVVTRYPVRKKKGRYFIQAGQLNGFEEGAVVEVFADVASEEPLAVLEVTDSQIASSEASLKTGEFATKKAFAQLHSPAYPAKVRFKWQKAPPKAWQTALETQLEENLFLQRTIDWVDSDQPADISLYVTDNKVYFFTVSDVDLPCELVSETECQPTRGNDTYLSLDVAQQTPLAILNNGLQRVIRAHNLKRLAVKMTGTSSVMSEVFLNDNPLGLDQLIAAKDGDDLYMSFVNKSRKPVDLTVMFIDSGLGITQIFPEIGFSGRLFAGEFAEFEGTVSNEESKGEEQFVVIAIPSSRDAPQTSLAHLQQEPLDSSVFEQRTTSKSRSSSDSYQDVFAQALGDLPMQRAFVKRDKSSGNASISVIRLKTE